MSGRHYKYSVEADLLFADEASHLMPVKETFDVQPLPMQLQFVATGHTRIGTDPDDGSSFRGFQHGVLCRFQ
ncbi:hypothetical protein D3C87_1566800 [compost metagenome]